MTPSLYIVRCTGEGCANRRRCEAATHPSDEHDPEATDPQERDCHEPERDIPDDDGGSYL